MDIVGKELSKEKGPLLETVLKIPSIPSILAPFLNFGSVLAVPLLYIIFAF